MASKYPPRDDEGLLNAGHQFLDNVEDPTVIGLTADDVTRLTTAVTEGDTAFNEHKTAQSEARNKTAVKDSKLDLIEDILQEFNGRTQGHPGMTDEKRTALGLPIYDSVKSSAPVPTEMPNVTVNTATPMFHILEFSRDGGKGKPEGVREIEFWFKLGGDATGNPNDYTYLGRDTESPYTKQFAAADSGKQVHYLCCWLNAQGERGPWKMISATVTSELQQSSD